MKRARISAKKSPFVMQGGPLDGHTLWLCTPGTLTFTLHGQTGSYDRENKWVPA